MKAKGAETRYLVPFCLGLAYEMWQGSQSDHHHMVFIMVQALHDFYMIMMNGKWHQQEASNQCQIFMDLYKKLHLEALSMKQRMWYIKPKFHLFQELVQYQALELGNPRGFWEYKDEDFVGWVATMATRRGGSNTHRVLADKVLNRYRAMCGKNMPAASGA